MRESAAPAGRLHVLIVDDSLTVRMDLRGALHGAGFLVTACDTKAAARKALRSRSYDLIILDVLLPDGSGLELVSELRATSTSSRTPIIVLSTETAIPERFRGPTMGADAYVGKPYDGAHVVQCALRLTGTRPTLPAAPAVEAARGPTAKVLVAGESISEILRMAEALRREGLDVLIADSGSKALELLSSEAVDGVLLDFAPERPDGVLICRYVRASSTIKTTPIVMVSDRDDRLLRARALTAGADDYTPKSAGPEALKARLRGLPRKERGSPDSRSRGAQEAAPSTLRRTWPIDLTGGSPLQRAMVESGIARILDPITITRACRRMGIDVASDVIAPADARRVLPEMRALLLLFLSHDQTEWYLRRLSTALGL